MFWKENRKRRWWEPGFTMDKSCRLYLPFYLTDRLGGSAIRDWSPYGNHGVITGAQHPGLMYVGSGLNLITNGGMENGNPPIGWYAVYNPSVFERSSLQKRTGNYSAHLVGSNYLDGFAQAVEFLDDNKWYKTSFWYYLIQGKLYAQVFAENTLGSVLKTAPMGYWSYGEFLWYKVPGRAMYSLLFQDLGTGGDSRLETYIDDVTTEEVVACEALGCGFDGIDDYIDCGNVSVGENAITVLMWFYASWDADNPTGQHRVFLFKEGSLGLNREVNYNTIFLKRDIRLTGGYEPYWAISFGSQLGWNLYGYTYDAATGVETYYRNGNFYGQRPTLGGTIVNTANNLYIGTNFSRYANETIGELAIFDRAWSATEIKNYYERTRHRYGNFNDRQ